MALVPVGIERAVERGDLRRGEVPGDVEEAAAAGPRLSGGESETVEGSWAQVLLSQ